MFGSSPASHLSRNELVNCEKRTCELADIGEFAGLLEMRETNEKAGQRLAPKLRMAGIVEKLASLTLGSSV